MAVDNHSNLNRLSGLVWSGLVLYTCAQSNRIIGLALSSYDPGRQRKVLVPRIIP